MNTYLLKRFFLIIPTLLGIITINFFVIQTSPGGPVEQLIATLEGEADGNLERITGSGSDDFLSSEVNEDSETQKIYKGAQGLDEELLEEINKLYGFDKPIEERFFKMLKDYLLFDFGNSFFRDAPVVDLILEKLPVSISLGLWSTLIMYLVSIPLGIKKAINHGTKFDVYTSTIIIVTNAIPVFLFAIILIIFFAGGQYLDLFPLRGLFSDNINQMSTIEAIKDYFWHLALPITAMVIGSFAGLTMLTKNSFLDEIKKQYVLTAKAKGLSETKVLYKHVFRNAMLLIISGFPAAFIGIFFTGSLLIEIIFSLDGLGLLGFEATLNRDYPVMFATLYIFTLIGLITSIISDITYMIVDPRINFETQK
ncbi:MAG: microcin C ABC transporter permease YejB [Campylobacterales bacterium]|nr:microcin C ABC transporter permease YejB [Campylobacterales bacterium]